MSATGKITTQGRRRSPPGVSRVGCAHASSGNIIPSGLPPQLVSETNGRGPIAAVAPHQKTACDQLPRCDTAAATKPQRLNIRRGRVSLNTSTSSTAASTAAATAPGLGFARGGIATQLSPRQARGSLHFAVQKSAAAACTSPRTAVRHNSRTSSPCEPKLQVPLGTDLLGPRSPETAIAMQPTLLVLCQRSTKSLKNATRVPSQTTSRKPLRNQHQPQQCNAERFDVIYPCWPWYQY